jgi:hypothetical protein
MKLPFLLFFCFTGLVSFAQELSNPNIFTTNNQLSNVDFYSGEAVSLSQYDGYLKPARRQFSVQQGNVYGEDNDKKINMMAMARRNDWQKKNGIVEMQFPSKQLQSINGSVQVYYGHQENFKYRTNFNLNYDGQGTPDGGIRNEVYKDVSQPTYNPYYFQGYNLYNNRRRSNNSSNFNFYITR